MRRSKKTGPLVPFALPIASRTAELLRTSETPGWRDQGPRSAHTSAGTPSPPNGGTPAGHCAALQAILGHRSVKVTEIYGAISDDLVEREATRVTEVRAGRNRTKNGTASWLPRKFWRALQELNPQPSDP